jgi:hypothetical protein
MKIILFQLTLKVTIQNRLAMILVARLEECQKFKVKSYFLPNRDREMKKLAKRKGDLMEIKEMFSMLE